MRTLDIDNSLRDMLDTVVGVVPKLVVFVVILLIGWLVARVLRKVVGKLLGKVDFDKLADRGGLRRYLGSYDPSQFVAMLGYYAVLLIALQMAFGVFGPNPVSAIITSIVAFLPRLFVATLIVVVVAAIGKAVHDVIAQAIGGLSYGRMLARAAQFAIVALGVIAALNQIGIATTVTMPILITLLATAGAVVAIGVGGGLIAPMRERWERILTHGETEAGTIRTHLRTRASERQESTERQYDEDYPWQPGGAPQPDPVAASRSSSYSGSDPYSGGLGPRSRTESGQYAPRESPN